MGKIIDKATAEIVGKNFLESVRPVKPDLAVRALKADVKALKLDLIHQGASRTKFAKRSKSKTRAKLLTLKQDEDPCFYVFNSSEKGFVIVSADDSIEPIFGYSDENSFDERNIPPAMVEYLENMRLDMLQKRKNKKAENKDITSRWKELKKGNKSNKSNAKETKKTYGNSGSGLGSGPPSFAVMGPFIKTKWDQGPPYNLFCPKDCPTGCVATAMAQIMFYYGFPDIGTGSHTCSEKNKGFASKVLPGSVDYNPNNEKVTANFGATTYRWDFMPQKLTEDLSPFSEINSVATLMLHCGISADMDYTTKGSYAYVEDAKNALKNYFKYDKDIGFDGEGVSGMSENKTWENLLISELKNLRPILYCGEGSGSHAFICDGFSTNGLFHFNWGWGGSWDGYFSITGLRPGTDDNFNIDNNFIFKIIPNGIRHLAYVSTSPETHNEENPIIFPYGIVPVIEGHTRTFAINKHNIGADFVFENVKVNGSIQNTTLYEDRERITVSSKPNGVNIVVNLRKIIDFELSGVIYRPLKESDYRQVEVFGVRDYATIPDRIKTNVYYEVVRVSDYAFRNNTELISIRVGEKLLKKIARYAFSECTKLKYVSINVSEIGDYAFERCKSLKRITSYSEQPPSCGQDVFKGLSISKRGGIKLYVYEDSVPAYQSAEVWKDFYILPMSKQSSTYEAATYPRDNNDAEHEVHKSICPFKSLNSNNLIYLGQFSNSGESVLSAMNYFEKTDGCNHCCPEEHTR